MLYGCETWSLTLREESRLRVFENRILRRILGPKSDVNGVWRRPCNEELHSLYRSHNKVRVIKSTILKQAGHVVIMKKVGLHSKFYQVKVQEIYLQEVLLVDGSTILQWNLNTWVSIRRIQLIRLRLRIVGEPM